MWKTVLKRVLMMIPQMFLLSVIVFLLAKAMPGDPFSGLIAPGTDPAQIERLRELAGLNDPWWQQYLRWMGNALHGDFGVSFVLKQPVSRVMGDRIGNTLWLSLMTTIILYIVGIWMGMVAARNEGKWQDKVLLIYNSITYGIPPFIIYLFAIFIFGYTLRWFPTGGTVDVNASGFFGVLFSKIYHMILPAVTMALLGTVTIFTYIRTGILDEQVQDYVRTARAKGVSENVIFKKHILRNALLPIAANLGFTITGLLSGAIFAETIFGYPGIGQLFTSSIVQRDYPMLTTLILFSGILALIGSLLSDIIMAWVDPRIRID
ncbi:ABC transporter permease [Floricoccus penangensis]|uniref:ABC transporter permease n=1 Tax=Floricoccus penangensis TaxID=1859475 RepID=UPI002040501E|nr:ABC transporter permease [Floricoccus penangensis]URZ87910.1 ABC transporter permease [Floricoccus penangensis]